MMDCLLLSAAEARRALMSLHVADETELGLTGPTTHCIHIVMMMMMNHDKGGRDCRHLFFFLFAPVFFQLTKTRTRTKPEKNENEN